MYTLVLSAEHASNHVPKEVRALFATCDCTGHTAYDIGIQDALKALQKRVSAPIFFGSLSRLVIDLNRSLSNPKVFSSITKHCALDVKNKLINDYYTPYRQAVIGAINVAQSVIHLSVHSFTPELNGVKRNADIGLLYDPTRPNEKRVAQFLKDMLAKKYSVRMNYPYRGTSDGFTSYLRGVFSKDDYVGLEIELNQRLSQKEMFVICSEIYDAINSHALFPSKAGKPPSH